ncbi:MAG: glycosyltransferase family 2 protein, partial [Chloroflexota bacterium]
ADWLAPLDTNRRTIVEWFLNVSSLRTPKKKVSDILENQVKVQSTSSDRLPLVPNSYQEAIGVSVIVPTKNGGNQFQHQLTMLQKQQGLQDIELIIVDSGSTDGTPEIAEQFGAKVIRIQPEAFSHSYARNLGADHATNPYLLFTVQDALPPSEQWLFDLVSIVQNTPDVVAASCAEYPRADADLFYRVVSWGHYQFLGTNSQDRIVGQPSDTSHESLRKNGNLSDVACLIEREIFLQYRYRGDYAEDLDLGIRLIQDDYKLALLGSIRVIHSHNRPAYYHLRRGYVDEQQLTKILPNRPCLAHDTNRLLRDIVFIYGLIDKLITQDLAHIPLPCKTPHLAKTVLDRMNLGRQDVFVKSSALPQTSYVDNQLAVFMETVYQQHYDVCLNGANQQRYDGILLDAMLEFMQTIFTYMRNTYEWIDEVILDDFKYSLYKGFAFQTGVHLSSCYTQDIGDARSVLNTINHELVQGV